MDETMVSKGERTREEITAAAFRLFLERGYHGTSMRQIAQEAGIAVGGIYNHFSGKEDIFISVLLQYHPYLEVLPALRSASGDTLEAWVKDAARRTVSAFHERTDFLNLMFIELVEFDSKHIPQLFEQIFPQILTFGQRFAQDRREMRAIPLPIVLRALLGLFFSYIITDLILGRQMPPEMQTGALDYFIDIYLHGILAEKAVSP